MSNRCSNMRNKTLCCEQITSEARRTPFTAPPYRDNDSRLRHQSEINTELSSRFSHGSALMSSTRLILSQISNKTE